MASYDGAEAVYQELGGVLSTVLENAERREALQKTASVFQFALTEPEATITVLARPGAPAAVGTGSTEVPVELVFAMTAETAKALLLGERNAMSLLAAGEIALKGPAAKLLMVLTALVGASDVASTAEADAAPSVEPEPEPEPEPEDEPAEAEDEPAGDDDAQAS
ncbi:MAG: SCP2 sterol-binding domain-containing protein [Baekduia sp.]